MAWMIRQGVPGWRPSHGRGIDMLDLLAPLNAPLSRA
jgi:hypothetical protein